MDLRKRLRPKGLISSNAILFQQNLRSIQILISHKKIILQGQTHDTSFQNDHTGRKIMFLSYSSLQCYIYVAKKCCSFFDAYILRVVFSSFFITFKTFFWISFSHVYVFFRWIMVLYRLRRTPLSDKIRKAKKKAFSYKVYTINSNYVPSQGRRRTNLVRVTGLRIGSTHSFSNI